MSTSSSYSVPLFDLAVDLRPYMPLIDPDVEKYHDVVRSDWSIDEIIVFAYLTAINDYNTMLTRFVGDNGAEQRQLQQLTGAIHAIVGSRFSVRKD